MEKKLIVRIAEGLGNQLFMYANGYALSKDLNYVLYIDDKSGFIKTKNFKNYYLDRFNLSSQIISDDDFVSRVKFFKSRRIDGNQRYLDLLCESFLTDSQLKSFEYSDTMARFKIRDMLKKHLNKKVTMSLWKRDVYPVYRCLQKNT